MLVAFIPVGGGRFEEIGKNVPQDKVEETVNAFLKKKGIPAKYRVDGYIKDADRNTYGHIGLWNDDGSPLSW